ncbi:MAG: hypothetical protein IT445_10940 [Phycisphaeraceae bacterium]|nr:hypothetical protein [Phycisphaeraceae bacterium]
MALVITPKMQLQFTVTGELLGLVAHLNHGLDDTLVTGEHPESVRHPLGMLSIQTRHTITLTRQGNPDRV